MPSGLTQIETCYFRLGMNEDRHVSTQCSNCSRAIPNLEPAAIVGDNVFCRRCHAEAEPRCPHCGGLTGRALPKSAGKCKSCGERFRVERDQCLFQSVLLTAQQASDLSEVRRAFRRLAGGGLTEAEFERCCLASLRTDDPAGEAIARLTRAKAKRAVAIESALTPNDRLAVVIDDARRILGRFSVDPSPAECAGRASDLSEQFGAVPSPSDLAWAVLTDMGIRARSHEDLKGVFDAQARFLATEGRDHRDAQRRSYQHELEHLAESGIERVEILAHGACAECARQNGERWAIRDALARMPLPCSSCTNTGVYGSLHGFCRCSYSAVFDD